MFLLKTLSAKLILLLFFILAAAFGILSYITIKKQNIYFMENTLSSAERMSGVIGRSLNQGMLLNQKEHVRKIIKDVSGEAGIEAIHIFNKKGETIYSSFLTGAVAPADPDHEACRPCHARGQITADASRERLFRLPTPWDAYVLCALAGA